jgi:hypothetical protein
MGTTRGPHGSPQSGSCGRLGVPIRSQSAHDTRAYFPFLLAWSAVTGTVATPSMQRLSPLIKAAGVPPSRLQTSFRNTRFARSLASVAIDSKMPSAARPNLPPRQLSTTSGDFDSSNSPDIRRQLGTYGLTPPAVESFEVQSERCQYSIALSAPAGTYYSYIDRPQTPGHEAHTH